MTTQLGRVVMLTTGPVLRTLAGTRGRIATLDWDDLRSLCRHYQCDIGELEVRMWQGRKKRKDRSARSGQDSKQDE